MKYDLLVRYMDASQQHEARLCEVIEPAAVVRAFTLNNDIAASAWISCEVYAPNGERIANLAYNGKEI